MYLLDLEIFFLNNDMTNLELKIIITTGKSIYCILAFQAFHMGRTICKRSPIIFGQSKCLLVPFLFLSS